MKTINLGILAHVDAGKTSLTERLLFEANIIDHMGSVDSGNTHTDSLELEQKRGITIQASVVSFRINNVKINLIDTPGHADFIAEVERTLSVIDAVILVISAVEGIQTQTRILMNVLKKLNKPTLIFVNKIDRKGARYNELIKDINSQFNLLALPMVSVTDIGSKEANVDHLTTKDINYYKELLETLTLKDELFLEQSINKDLIVSKDEIIKQIISQVNRTDFYPIYFGSAFTGAGIDALFVGIEHYLPYEQPHPTNDIGGTIFKIERNAQGDKIAYVDLRSGTLEVRKPITLYHPDTNTTSAEKISSIKLFDQGGLANESKVSARSIAQLFGLHDVRIGDGLSEQTANHNPILFSRPTLQVSIVSTDPKNNLALFTALKALSEQDPLIGLHKDKEALLLNLYGEVQKEIIKDRLKLENNIDVLLGDTKMLCIERPLHIGEASHFIDPLKAPLEFYATLGFKIEPGEIDSGIEYRMEQQSGKLPKGYHSVVRKAVFTFLNKGLQGWPVTDCIVTLTEAGTCPLSMAPHFRQLTPILLHDALIKSKTQVCEPYCSFELETPISVLNNVLLELANHQANIIDGAQREEIYQIKGQLLTKHLQPIQALLPGLTQGRGILVATHAGYKNVSP